MKEVIFITGIAGMVGSNLLKKYINQNKIIIGIDNFELGKEKFIKDYFKFKNFFFLKINLNKKVTNKNLEKILKKNSLREIWLLAANSDISKGIKNTSVDLNNTFLTTVNSLEFLKPYIKKNTKILFTSTSAIYGNVNKSVSENNSIVSPVSNYGAMKAACEAYISSFSFLNDANTFIFRFPNVIGKNLTHGLLFDMKKKINSKKNFINVLGNGKQQKPYSHVNEILSCMMFVKNKKYKKRMNVFNIGTNDKGIKVKDIVIRMLKIYKSNKKIKFGKSNIGWKGDVPTYRYNTKKINDLGFKFRINSKESVIKAIKENI